ncbi:hypothetical protein CBR_g34540 [Chara braunii]|uniref:Reverse transcriptase n=1 Tax=Chara braunii TaxID=69332 RepID=A0A388LJ10_CHABU|nr:hypothetical protein CBR_g34540 [Chara braunii]|eukprot:GBG82257.1 hypothetical protein CBR_g34540 [Chara braunii]
MGDADGIERGPGATPEDFVKALEKREMTRLQVPKVNIFHFNGDRVSEWLELLEQVTSEASEEDKFKLMPRYVWWELRPEVMKVAADANGEWAKCKEEMQRRFKLGDGLLTKEDLEMLRRDEFSTVGAFATAFEKMTKKVPGLAEEEQCATFLGHFKNWEGLSLTKKAAPGKKLTWAAIKEGVMDGELDQVDIFQMRQARKKRKALDATTSHGRDFKKMVEDAVAQLDSAKEARRKTMAVPLTQGKAKKAVVQEEEEEEEDEEEEEETEPQKLTKAQRPPMSMASYGCPGPQAQQVSHPDPPPTLPQQSAPQGSQGNQGGGRGQNQGWGRGRGNGVRGGNGRGNGGGNAAGGGSEGWTAFGSQGGQEGGRGVGRGRIDWRNAICWQCGQKGHTIKFCHERRNDEDEGLISTNYDGDMYDKWGYHLDPRTPGGTRKEALRRAEAGEPPAPPAMFRMWQEKKVHSDIRVEEVGENEEVEQGRKVGTIKIEPIIMESDDEIEEDCWNRPLHAETGEDYWRTAQETMERMEDLINKVRRYQQKLADMCGEVKGWQGKEPSVYLYDLGPGSQGGSGNLPNVTTSGATPRSGMTFRPPSRTGRAPHAVRTRAKGPMSPEEPAKDVPEPSGEKEVVDVPEGEDDEDDRLRKEEDERAEQRAKKRGARPDTDKAQEVKKKKYAVRVEEGFDVEEIMDRIQEGHNYLMNLKNVLASAPRLRDELRARLSRNMVVSIRLGTIIPKEADRAETGTKMDWKSVACGCLDVVVKGKTCTAMVGSGAKMNLIKEEHAVRLGMEIDRSDNGVLMGVNSRSIFIGTASSVILEIGKVKVRSCFFVMPDLDHPILLGRSFLSRTETVILNKHDETMFLVLCDPVCGNYEAITCKNTGPKSVRNRPNPGSFTIEESEEERLRIENSRLEEVKEPEALTLSLANIGDAMDIVSTYGMAEHEAVEALREKVVEQMGAGEMELVYLTPGPTALGGVLIQRDPNGEEQPLRFESRTLNTSERNYSEFKRETLAVLHCLRIFRNYLFGNRFVLRVDATALAGSLKNFAPSDPTIARWLTYIWMFDFELERIPGNKNRADGLSPVDWDKNHQGVIKDTPPVDGFLDSEEDVRLHINSWALAVGKYVTPGRPIWLAPPGHVRWPDLVLKPYIEEDSWGMSGVGWMMELTLASKYELQEDPLTIENEALQVGKHEKMIGGVYLLANALLQEETVKNTVLDQEEEIKPGGGDNVIHEREDDDFEEGEIQEAFRAEEDEEVYLELGMLLSCEMREKDVCARVLKMRPSFLVRDGHLFMRSKGRDPRRVVCGVARQIDIMAALHDGMAGGHRGADTTYLKIHELYYWDGMGQMIDDYCKFCVSCQERSALRRRESLHPRYVREVGAVVHLDLLAMPLGIGSYNFIFDARNNLSGFVDGRVIRTKTGETLARCIEEYYLRYPFVSRFVMDRGSEFTCAEVKALLKKYGVIAEYTTATHPQANAPVERGHSTITNLLAKWTDGRPNQWPNFLRVAFFVDNITIRRSTGYAPATLWYGRHATFPIESFLKTWRRQDLETDLTFEELLDLRARQIGVIEDRIEEAASRTADSRTKDKFRWDKMARVRKEPLKVGDVVLLYDSSLEKQWSRKLDKRWLGPYRVTRCGEHGAYQIEELNGTAWKDWVSGSRLKKFVARGEQGKAPEEVEGRKGKGTCTQEEDPPLFSEVWMGFDKLMDTTGRSGGQHQETGVKLVSTDLLNLRSVTREGFAAARTSDQKIGDRLTKVAQKAYGQRVNWEREAEGLKRELGRQGKELAAVKADIKRVSAENEAARQVNQTLNKITDALRVYMCTQLTFFQVKETEWEKIIRNLEAKYTQQAPTRVLDWAEVQKFEIREQPAEEVFKREKEVEMVDQQEGEEIPLIDKEMLEQPGVFVKKGAEVGEFEWRLPAGLTLGHEPAVPQEGPPVEAMRAGEVPPTIRKETVRQQEGQESVGQIMAETE